MGSKVGGGRRETGVKTVVQNGLQGAGRGAEIEQPMIPRQNGRAAKRVRSSPAAVQEWVAGAGGGGKKEDDAGGRIGS
jgi:hypothetical protein